MPNKGPDELAINQLRLGRLVLKTDEAGRLRIALFGSDSRKKRYEDLFRHAAEAEAASRLSFLIYGHPTDYYRELCERFPKLDIRLASSSETSMEDFLTGIDVVASVAEHEGFGRPIALALAAGIPCFLLASPVFTEFFGRSTQLYASTAALVHALLVPLQRPTLQRQFEELPEIRAAYRSAAQRLSTLAAHGEADR